MSILFGLVGLIYIGYRLWRSALAMEHRRVFARYRLIGVIAATVLGSIFEMRVGFSPLGIDPRLDLIIVPFVWAAAVLPAEWFGEQELKRLGVKRSGMTSRKQY